MNYNEGLIYQIILPGATTEGVMKKQLFQNCLFCKRAG